jgi:hypothetical protein
LPALLFVQQAQLVWALVWALKELQVSRHSFFVFVLLSTFMHCLLECLGFTWYLISALPVLPIPQPCLFNDLPSFVTICTPQGLVVKVTCMHDGWIIAEGFPERAWAFLLSTVFVHHLAPPESLGIIAWLQHCGFLAACAKHGGFKESPDWCHECPNS